MTDVVAILANGFIYGSIYGLVAIGMTLIYGTLRILDMSQGSMVMAGSYVGWWALAEHGVNALHPGIREAAVGVDPVAEPRDPKQALHLREVGAVDIRHQEAGRVRPHVDRADANHAGSLGFQPSTNKTEVATRSGGT